MCPCMLKNGNKKAAMNAAKKISAKKPATSKNKK